MRQRVYLIYHKRRYVLVRCPKRTVCNADCSITASEKCHQEKRKTVNGEDILFAMTSLGFENYAEALKIYLSKYREVSFFLLQLVFLLYNYQSIANGSHRPNQHAARTGQAVKEVSEEPLQAEQAGPQMRPHRQPFKAEPKEPTTYKRRESTTLARMEVCTVAKHTTEQLVGNTPKQQTVFSFLHVGVLVLIFAGF